MTADALDLRELISRWRLKWRMTASECSDELEAALVRAGGVPQPETEIEEVMPSEPDKLHLQHDPRSSSVPDPQHGASAVTGEQYPVSNTARAGGVERTPAYKDYGIYSPETERELSTVYTGHLGDEKYPTDAARGAVEPPAPDFRQGCKCKCCDHSEGSDCACECHASGACSVRVEPPAQEPLELLLFECKEAATNGVMGERTFFREHPSFIPRFEQALRSARPSSPPAEKPVGRAELEAAIASYATAGPNWGPLHDEAVRDLRLLLDKLYVASPPPAKDLEDQMWGWREAALLKDRTRAAIRDRARAGEVLEALAEDYVVPLAFVQHLISWQMFGDESASPPPADMRDVAIDDHPVLEAAYCHHRHHLAEHSTDFYTCPHRVCVSARILVVSPPPATPQECELGEGHCNPFRASCGAKFCTPEEAIVHHQVYHPAAPHGADTP